LNPHRAVRSMFLDYLLAVLIGCAGMAAAYHLATDILLLHGLISQLTFAELALREMRTIAQLFNIADGSPMRVCDQTQHNLSAESLSKTCVNLVEWLGYLPSYEFSWDVPGTIALSWQDPTGARASLSMPLASH
jgi:hypothetical protein